MSPSATPGSEKPERRWRSQLKMVRDHRLMKIVQGYRNAWWRKQDDPKGAGGRIFTDLPLRQLYYFDREWLEERGRYRSYGKKDQVNKGANGKPAATEPEIQGMVVAYLDGHYASFWRFIPAVILELRRRRRLGTGQKSTTIAGIEEEKRGVFGDRIWGWLEPKEDLRNSTAKKENNNEKRSDEKWSDEECARHLYFYWQGLFERASTKMHLVLKQLHSFSQGLKDRIQVPAPVAGAYAFWENFGEHFEAGWHTWEPGVDSTLAMKYMVQPFKDQEVYVCGEAYSSEQGWIEGPLKSVEMVMDRLGVMLPDEKLEPKTSEEKKESEGIRDYVGLPPRE